MQINLRSYFKLLRTKDWRAYFFMVLIGFIISRGFLFPLKDIFLFWAIIFFLLGFGFSINDCFDVKEDKYHKDKEKLLVNKKISFKKGLIFSLTIGILGLAISSIFGLKIFLFCLGAVLLAFFYSVPPLRLKGRIFLDLISHGLFAGSLIFILPLLIFKSNLTIFHYLFAFSIFYYSIILELRNHLEDCEIDRKVGLKTTVCVLGFQKSEKILRSLTLFYPLLLFPIFLLFFRNSLLFLFLIFTILFLFFFLLVKNQKMEKNYRILDFYTAFSWAVFMMGTVLS